jgi:hypothetical protein
MNLQHFNLDGALNYRDKKIIRDIPDICKECPVFQEKEKFFLDTTDSIFEALSYMKEFIMNCKCN